MPTFSVHYRYGGVHLPELGLWLDPGRRQLGDEIVFVSHAHSDHIAAHREVILTHATSKLMRTRLRGERKEHVLAFGQTQVFQRGGRTYQAALCPAGHILGSAMARLETPQESLLFTGDFKLRAGLAAEACEPQTADILIMETTFGRPIYRFPDRLEIVAAMTAFCQEALAEGSTPVLLAYSLGKSQELLCALSCLGLPVQAHPTIYHNARLYEYLGQRLPPCEKAKTNRAGPCVVLWPPGTSRAPLTEFFGKVRIAVVSGWAVESSFRYRHRADASFPLSDHADFDELLELVRRVAPRKVYTLHGFAADFAQTLRERGYDAQALSQEEQLQLPLGPAPAGGVRPRIQ